MQVIQNDVIKCCKMMSSNVALLHSNNCCVLEPAICEDLDLHVVIFLLFFKFDFQVVLNINMQNNWVHLNKKLIISNILQISKPSFLLQKFNEFYIVSRKSRVNFQYPPSFSRFHVIFSWYLLNFSKFHDISRFSRCTLIFPGFPGFPGQVGTLKKIIFFYQFYSGHRIWHKTYSKNCYMLVWTSGLQNPFLHTDFNIKPDTPINVYTRFCLNTAKSKFSLVSPVADWWKTINKQLNWIVY